MTKKIKVRSMTFNEFDAYQDYVDSLKDKKVKEDKMGRLAARWVMEQIYKIDLDADALTPGEVMQIVADTTEATLKTEEQDEKN